MQKWGFHIKQMNLGEHQNIHTRYIQHKYAFLHKMLYKLIVSTHSYVMVFDWTVKETRCKKKIRDTLISQKWSVSVVFKIFLSL